MTEELLGEQKVLIRSVAASGEEMPQGMRADALEPCDRSQVLAHQLGDVVRLVAPCWK